MNFSRQFLQRVNLVTNKEQYLQGGSLVTSGNKQLLQRAISNFVTKEFYNAFEKEPRWHQQICRIITSVSKNMKKMTAAEYKHMILRKKPDT